MIRLCLAGRYCPSQAVQNVSSEHTLIRAAPLRFRSPRIALQFPASTERLLPGPTPEFHSTVARMRMHSIFSPALLVDFRRFSSTDRRRLTIRLSVSLPTTCSEVSPYPSWTLIDVSTRAASLFTLTSSRRFRPVAYDFSVRLWPVSTPSPLPPPDRKIQAARCTEIPLPQQPAILPDRQRPPATFGM